MARGDNGIAGLNVVGLRRAGFTAEQRLELKRTYLGLFRSDLPRATALETLSEQFQAGSPALELLEFIRGSKRGICADTGRRGRLDPSET
jgi:UDP-N-acetylglucosamine acyltransferase